MKPDEHKKKKNELYKKKHNIKIPKAKVENSETKDDAPKFSKNDIVETKMCIEHHQGIKPSFHRRKIESNWERYSENSDLNDDHMLGRGANFKEILQNAGSVKSQFRFKDERSLDEEQNSNTTALTIDCEHLAKTLGCTPLHIRLNIETSHFQEVHLSLFKTEAAHHTSMNDKQKPKSASNIGNDYDSSVCGVTCVSSNQATLNNTPVAIREQATLDRYNKSPISDNKNLTETNSEFAAERTRNIDEISSVTIHVPTSDAHPILDNDPSSQITEQDVTLIHSSPVEYTESDCLEDELDALLSLDDNPVPLVQQPSVVTPLKTTQVCESLDDWLDSVLDE